MSLLVMAALAVGFTSCNNGDEPNVVNNGETKTVVLKLAGSAPTLYAETPQVTGDSDIEFASGHLYFVDEAGMIVSHYELITGTTDLAAKKLSINEAAGGAVIPAVPAEAKTAHVVGNTTLTISEGSSISTVKETVLNVESQKNVASLNLYGEDVLVVDPADNKKYSCTVDLKSTVARFEILQVRNVAVAGTDETVSAFTVEGVFIDRYYSGVTVAGVLDGSVANNGSSADTYKNETAAYPSNLSGAVYDWGSWGADASFVANPGGSNVWAYNLPAAIAGGTEVPRIIFRLTVAENATTNKTGFLTVNSLTEGSSAITEILPGNVYRITSIDFESKYNSSGGVVIPPEEPVTEVDVTVTIKPATWKVKTVTPVVTQ